MSDQILVPRSEGALLAEEWSIDPLSTLPSFLEMKFIEEASLSGHMALKSLMDMIIERIQAFGDSQDSATSRNFLSVTLLQNYANRLASLLRQYNRELRGLLVYFIERQCLRMLSSTVAESIYGTKRAVLQNASVDKQPNARKIVPINEKHATRLALLIAAGPYLGELFDKALSSIQRGRGMFVLLLRLVKTTVAGANFLCKWCFLLNKSPFFDLKSFVLGQVVRRATLQDSEKAADAVAVTPSSPSMPSHDSVGSSHAGRIILSAVSATIAFSWLTQMRAMWQNYTTQRRTSRGESGPRLPPPPHLTFPTQDNVQTCPLCRQHWREPTASPSGFVFCHHCILNYLRENKRCPVTGIECSPARLVRLYEPQQPARG